MSTIDWYNEEADSETENDKAPVELAVIRF